VEYDLPVQNMSISLTIDHSRQESGKEKRLEQLERWDDSETNQSKFLFFLLLKLILCFFSGRFYDFGKTKMRTIKNVRPYPPGNPASLFIGDRWRASLNNESFEIFSSVMNGGVFLMGKKGSILPSKRSYSVSVRNYKKIIVFWRALLGLSKLREKFGVNFCNILQPRHPSKFGGFPSGASPTLSL